MKNKFLIFLKKLENFIQKNDNKYYIIIFIACVCVHFCVSLIGWNNLLLDQYGFRQTQTAITTFYTIKEGFLLSYITPVFGAPWSIPFEFPLFQWIVAMLVLIFKTPIDQTGRFLSLLFFYLSLIPMGAILKLYSKKLNYVLIILSLVLLNPIYLFWSRTFMIESLALFLSLSFCWLTIKLFKLKKPIFLISASLVGSLAALVKITTFAVLCVPLAGFFLYMFFKEVKFNFPPINILKKYLLYGIVLFIIPIIIGIVWANFADAQKSINPLANGFITSKDLTQWNFGTIKQKIDFTVWMKILTNSLVPIKTFGSTKFGPFLFPNLFALLVLFFYFAKSYRKEILLSFIFFIMGPLMFTNLYLVHTYYFYATNFFISILLGFLIISLYESNNQKIKYFGMFVLFPFVLISLFFQYKTSYYPSQLNNEYSIIKATDAIKKYTKKDDIIFIYGQDWDSSFPYYAERKAIMDRKKAPLDNKIIQESIKMTGKISAFVVSNISDEKFIEDQIKYLNFNIIPIYNDGQTSIYLPK